MSEIYDGEGVVSKVGEPVTRGKRTYYNFTLEDDKTLYRTGTTEPDFEEGDEITFEYEDGDYGAMVDMDTVEIIGHQEHKRKPKKKAAKKTTVKRFRPARSATKKSSGGGGGSAPKEDWDARAKYWEQKDIDDKKRNKQIALSGAYNTALAILSKELDLELVKLGADKAAANKKLATFEALLQEKAHALWVELMNAGDLDSATGKVDDMGDDQDVGEDEEDADFDDE